MNQVQHITALKLAKQWFGQHRLPERPEDVTSDQVIKAIEIALAEANAEQEQPEQPWIFWGGGACPVPEGVTFEVTCRSGAVREQEEVSDWTHTGNIGDIIAYRITGLAEERVLK